jgi:hypothetical protein
VNSTDTTPAPAVGGRQVGQVLASRYRLAMFKGGDDIADVWHALDDSTAKVVTLEILRDRTNEAARQRFLAEAQRMAAIERPSVMRVAAIHNEAADTFIVFEHLIPLPVVLTGLTAVATDARPATRAAEAQAAEAQAAVAPQAPAPVAPATLAAVVGPKRSAAVPEPMIDDAIAPTIVDLDEMTAQRAPAAPEMSVVTDWRTRLASEARLLVRDVGMDTFAEDARAFIADARARVSQRFDTSVVSSLVARLTSLVASANAVVARVTSRAGRVGPASKARVPSARAAGPAKVRAMRVGVALPKLPSLGTSLPSLGTNLPAALRPFVARARGNRVVLGGAALVVVAVVVVASPLDDAVTNAARSRPGSSATVEPSAALVPAPFQVPPLAAYGAAFDSQGAYPTTTPNGTVEWVVALRNTGSAGWYRGIEGAQAALALPDGTGVAVQSTAYVAPGQVGWFVVRFRARAELGTYTVPVVPRIDGRGPLADLGIFAVVTVAKNP